MKQFWFHMSERKGGFGATERCWVHWQPCTFLSGWAMKHRSSRNANLECPSTLIPPHPGVPAPSLEGALICWWKWPRTIQFWIRNPGTVSTVTTAAALSCHSLHSPGILSNQGVLSWLQRLPHHHKIHLYHLKFIIKNVACPLTHVECDSDDVQGHGGVSDAAERRWLQNTTEKPQGLNGSE